MPIVVTETTPPVAPTFPSDGALFAGVEAIFEYNELELNDRTLRNRYRISQIGGLGGADIRDARQVRSGRDGERSLLSFYAGRTLTLGGRIEALDDHLHGLRLMTTNLVGAFAELTDKPLYINQGSLGGWDTQITCRASQPIALTEELKSWYHYRDFLITLRAADPRIVSQQEMEAEWTATDTAFVNEPIFVQENQGNYNADLRILLKGPMTDPILIIGNVYFTFLGGTTISAADQWVIDPALGTVTDLSGVNKFSFVSLSSTMPYFTPGANSVLFSGEGLTIGTSGVTINYRHSWI